MLIKPFRQEYEPSITLKGGFVKNQNTSEYKRRRVFSNKSGSVRIEEININPKTKTIVKNCIFGEFDKSPLNFGNIINVDDSMSITLDATTGKRKNFNIYSGIPNNSNSMTGQIVGNIYSPIPKTIALDKNDIVYNTDYIDDLYHTEYDKEKILYKIYAIEDIFQMSYSELVGFVSAFFSQWEFSYPFESEIIIDTKSEVFDIKSFKYLEGVIEKEIMMTLFASYTRDLSNLTALLSYNAKKENRNFRVLVYSTPFVSVIRIKDIKYPKEINETFSPSASNHFRSIINNVASKSDYDLTEEAGYIITNCNGDVSSEILETIDYIDDI